CVTMRAAVPVVEAPSFFNAHMGIHKQFFPVFLAFVTVEFCERRQMPLKRFRKFKLLLFPAHRFGFYRGWTIGSEPLRTVRIIPACGVKIAHGEHGLIRGWI